MRRRRAPHRQDTPSPHHLIVHGSLQVACAGKVKSQIPKVESRKRRRSLEAVPRSACSTIAGTRRGLLTTYAQIREHHDHPRGKRRMCVPLLALHSQPCFVVHLTVTSSVGTPTQKNKLVLRITISTLPSHEDSRYRFSPDVG